MDDETKDPIPSFDLSACESCLPAIFDGFFPSLFSLALSLHVLKLPFFFEHFLQLFALPPEVLCQLGSSPAAFEHLNLYVTENKKEIKVPFRNPLKQHHRIRCPMISSYS